MIPYRTTFVLGAGASMPYGFPSGLQLVHAIVNRPDDSLVADLCDCSPDKVAGFRRALQQSHLSIDAFLSLNPDYEAVGKTHIALCILASEASDKHLYDPIAGDGWYGYLWGQLVKGAEVTKPEPGTLFANTRVVTFNYDRSFEFFLTNALSSSFGMNWQEAYDILSEHLLIRHVYGSAGGAIVPSVRLHSAGVPYGNQAQFAEDAQKGVQRAAESIRVMYEDRGGVVDDTAEDYLTWAQRIVVLGFGFDETNMRRIGLAKFSVTWANRNGATGPAQILATTVGKTETEIRTAFDLIGSVDLRQHSTASGCLDFLRQTGVLLGY